MDLKELVGSYYIGDECSSVLCVRTPSFDNSYNFACPYPGKNYYK